MKAEDPSPVPDDFLPDRRQLLIATSVAIVIAGVVLVGAILPAEFGIDPTGIGGLLGLTALRVDGEPDEDHAPAQSLQEYQGTWPTTTTTLLEADVYVDSDGVSLPIVNAAANIAVFELIVTWTDDNATATQGTEPDLLEATVTPPRKEPGPTVLSRNAAGGEGRLETSRSVATVPAPATVLAATPEAGYFALQDLHPPDHEGTGEWILELRMEPGQARFQGVEIPGTDDGNDVHVVVQITTFALDANVTATGRATTHTFELDAGRGMEFKVYMDEGQTFNYAWNTTAGELYFDFHGDPAGGNGSDFVRHGEGRAPAAEGTFAAPFDGSHGWYWKNVHSEMVRVNLTLQGAYVLLE